MKAGTLALLCLLALVAGCGERPEPPPIEETVLKEQAEALDKARAVEEEMQKRKRELDAQVERDSGGGT